MIYIAADHRGFALKEKIKTWLTEWGMEFNDMGANGYDESDDYPDFVHAAAQKVSANPETDKAIVLGGSGQGEGMVANRHTGVRAMVYYGGSADLIAISRVHNDCNVLSLGAAPGMNKQAADPMSDEEAQLAVKTFLETPYTHDERHARRIAKIEQQ